jgi:membrane protein DedA with SNARE-associated domain
MPEWLVDLFARYGYTVVFVGVFLENTGLPVPGETALLAGAALAHFGRLSLGWVIVTAIVGATLGDNLGFAIGRRYGRGIVERHGWRIGLTRPRLAQFDRFFERHGARTVFIARFITGLRVFGAVLAGASGLPWRSSFSTTPPARSCGRSRWPRPATPWRTVGPRSSAGSGARDSSGSRSWSRSSSSA